MEAWDDLKRKAEEISLQDQEQFELMKKQWAEYCPGVDEVLEEYAKDVGGTIRKWRDDAPVRELEWERKHPLLDHPTRYVVSLMLDTKYTPVLNIYAASLTNYKDSRAFRVQLDGIGVTPTDIGDVREVVTLYGHTLRLLAFSESENAKRLLEELGNLSGPKDIDIKVSEIRIGP